MTSMALTRRELIAAAGTIAGASLGGTALLAAGADGSSPIQEVTLSDDLGRGYLANMDVAFFGPPEERAAVRNFAFPGNADPGGSYGIDIYHKTKDVPWAHLADAKVKYVYIKSSESINGRDGRFVEFWTAANGVGIPHGAYHFLTAGVSGAAQAQYFVKRLGEVGGLKAGDMQPVVDLEWDIYGPAFKLDPNGHNSDGSVRYKDYWDQNKAVPDQAVKTAVVQTMKDFVSSLVSQLGPGIKPVIYTNRSWWESHVPVGTVFPNCSVWISDYRSQSYADQSPRSVQGHHYYVWQFTDSAMISAGGKSYGPFDANKLMSGGIEHLLIA